MSYLRNSSIVFVFVFVFVFGFLFAACGSGGDGGGGSDVCGFQDRYLPYEAGYSWTYRVTDLLTGDTNTKSQSLTLETDATLGEVIVQTTNKSTGTTISALKVEADAVVRYRQEDWDQQGALKRTTTYDPGQRRLDEAMDKLTVGAQWDDIYTVTVTDPMGVQTSMGSRTDHWEVLGVDVDCSSPLGDFQCLHIKKQRTAGGVSSKDFFFARGFGKVKEINPNRQEELIACE